MLERSHDTIDRQAIYRQTEAKQGADLRTSTFNQLTA